MPTSAEFAVFMQAAEDAGFDRSYGQAVAAGVPWDPDKPLRKPKVRTKKGTAERYAPACALCSHADNGFDKGSKRGYAVCTHPAVGRRRCFEKGTQQGAKRPVWCPRWEGKA
jgi:hypothetical protein